MFQTGDEFWLELAHGLGRAVLFHDLSSMLRHATAKANASLHGSDDVSPMNEWYCQQAAS
jgi:hypothetical protein